MRRPPSSVPAVTRSKLVPLRRTSVLIFAQTAIRSLPEDRSWSTPADALSASTNVSTSPSNKRNRPFFRIFQENGLFLLTDITRRFCTRLFTALNSLLFITDRHCPTSRTARPTAAFFLYFSLRQKPYKALSLAVSNFLSFPNLFSKVIS